MIVGGEIIGECRGSEAVWSLCPVVLSSATYSDVSACPVVCGFSDGSFFTTRRTKGFHEENADWVLMLEKETLATD